MGNRHPEERDPMVNFPFTNLENVIQQLQRIIRDLPTICQMCQLFLLNYL